jgi:hypothetical protein
MMPLGIIFQDFIEFLEFKLLKIGKYREKHDETRPICVVDNGINEDNK